MKKVSVIGHYAYGVDYLDGQTIKTKIITRELCRLYGQSEVLQFDTHGGKKTLLKAPLYVWKALQKTRNVIILPAHNGLRVFGRLLPFFRHFFKDRKIHYVVIGGWLPQMLESKKSLANALKKFDAIYVETNTMKAALKKQGFENIFVMPNCKPLEILSENELVYPEGIPLKLCTFSRVMKEKGIETAVEIIRCVNQKLAYTAYSLDIYGQVDSAQTEWFEHLKTQFPEYVRYCGCVDDNQSVELLQSYYALLFPTHFYTEGIPGTIIDAYAAGIPVISAKWESYDDVVDDGITGIGYDFDDVTQLEEILLRVARNPKELLDLKENCIHKAKNYIPKTAIQIINKNIRGGITSTR